MSSEIPLELLPLVSTIYAKLGRAELLFRVCFCLFQSCLFAESGGAKHNETRDAA